MLRSRVVVLWVGLLMGCAGQPATQLHPVGGDAFTLFPEAARPPAIACSQANMEARFVCFSRRMKELAGGRGLTGGLVLQQPAVRISRVVTHGKTRTGSAMTEDTPMPVGSVTKMFVGITAVALSDAGRLDLQKPIADYLPQLSTEVGVGRATLHQLLTHTAGLGNPALCKGADTTAEELIALHGKEPLWAPPGAVHSYSNFGYVLVGAVLERVAGKALHVLVREHVLGPAGLGEAAFDPRTTEVEGQRPDGAPEPLRCPAMTAPGGLVLSPTQLGRWLAVALSARSPMARLLAKAAAPHVATHDRPGAFYGYGIARFTHGGATWLQHSGSLEDYSASVLWSPERGFGAAAVVNAPLAEGGALGAVVRAASVFTSAPLDWAPTPAPAHGLSYYSGTYRDQHGGLSSLRVDLCSDDALHIAYPGGPPPLLPPHFRFSGADGEPRAEYVVTPVGIGRRVPAAEPAPTAAQQPGKPSPNACPVP